MDKYIGCMIAVAICSVGIFAAHATQVDTGMNNPYALPSDHPTIDRERPTLTWCPDGPWQMNTSSTIYLSIHDNSRFNWIQYTIGGNTYDLLTGSHTVASLPLGYYEGTFYAEDVHGNYEDRYGFGVNFTTPSTLTIIMYYQDDQGDTYDCAGIDAPQTWEGFLPAAWATSDRTQFHTMTIQAGNATEQLTAAQVELEKLRTELAILEKQLALKAPDTTPFDQDDIDAALASLQTKHDAETAQIMTAVNQTLAIVNDVKTDVNRVIALCRQ